MAVSICPAQAMTVSVTAESDPTVSKRRSIPLKEGRRRSTSASRSRRSWRTKRSASDVLGDRSGAAGLKGEANLFLAAAAEHESWTRRHLSTHAATSGEVET